MSIYLSLSKLYIYKLKTCVSTFCRHCLYSRSIYSNIFNWEFLNWAHNKFQHFMIKWSNDISVFLFYFFISFLVFVSFLILLNHHHFQVNLRKLLGLIRKKEKKHHYCLKVYILSYMWSLKLAYFYISWLNAIKTWSKTYC